ncbi:hypothetical protein FJZ39_02090 [Candidatus Saccharibacteria bacterium]|nr:hypothetical protein [Candidatus Saccharibacteria bacterium]
MVSTNKKSRKKYVLIVAVVLMLIAVGALTYGYFRFIAVSDDAAKLLPNYAESESVATEANIVGSGDVQSVYLAYLEAGRDEDAERYITEKVDAAQGNEDKLLLLNQKTEMALVAQKYKVAERAARDLIEIAPTHGHYSLLARVALVAENYSLAQESYTKAAQVARSSDDESVRELAPLYENQRDSVGQFMEASNE